MAGCSDNSRKVGNARSRSSTGPRMLLEIWAVRLLFSLTIFADLVASALSELQVDRFQSGETRYIRVMAAPSSMVLSRVI